MLTIYLAALLCAYLIGSIPFGLLLGKLAGLGDIRKVGSGNIGATNMLRAGGKKLAIATLLLDMGKGGAAVYIGIMAKAQGFSFNAGEMIFSGLAHIPVLAGILAVLGHMFPVWLRGKGGKGVATAIGVLLALHPWLGCGYVLVWLAAFLLTRISSAGAIAASLTLPLLGWYFPPLFNIYGEDALRATADDVVLINLTLLSVLAALILWKHRENIRRIVKGEEHRFSFSSKKI